MSKIKKMTRKLTALSLSLIIVVMFGVSALPLWALADEVPEVSAPTENFEGAGLTVLPCDEEECSEDEYDEECQGELVPVVETVAALDLTATGEYEAIVPAGITLQSTGTEITDDFDCDNFLEIVREIISVSEPNPIHASYVESITVLEVRNRGITSLAGIEHFVALTELDVGWNQLTELDVSNNLALTELWVWDNQLTELDVSSNTALTMLDVSDNQLNRLVLGNNTVLTTLWAFNNQLTELDVSGNTHLDVLFVYNNQLTELDVSRNTRLTMLDVGDNQLTELNVSTNTDLTSLNVWVNQLTELDVSRNTALVSLDAMENRLTELNVSRNVALQVLGVGSNLLTELDVRSNPALVWLGAWDNQLATLNVSNNRALVFLDVRGNRIASVYDIIGAVNHPLLPGVDTYDEVWQSYGFLFNPQNIPANGGTTTPRAGGGTTTPPTNVPDAIPENTIANALLGDNPFIQLGEGDSTVISGDSLQAIRDSGSTLEIELPNGLVISIDPDSITDDARPIDLNIELTVTDTATYANYVQLPENAIIIAPAAHGAFGFTISFEISAQMLRDAGLSSDNVRLFHISADGVVTEHGSVRRNDDGSVTISIDHASRWVLSEIDLVLLTQAADPPAQVAHDHDVPQTGITGQMVLPIVLSSLGLASIGGAEAYRRSKKKSAGRQ